MFENFNWINEGEIKIEENKIVIKAPALTDFFLWRKYNQRRRYFARITL